MTRFGYIASYEGVMLRGVVEARDKAEAKRQLEQRHYTRVRVTDKPGQVTGNFFSRLLKRT